MKHLVYFLKNCILSSILQITVFRKHCYNLTTSYIAIKKNNNNFHRLYKRKTQILISGQVIHHVAAKKNIKEFQTIQKASIFLINTRTAKHVKFSF